MSVQTIKIKIGYLRRLPGRILRDIEYFRELKKRDFSKKKIYCFRKKLHFRKKIDIKNSQLPCII